MKTWIKTQMVVNANGTVPHGNILIEDEKIVAVTTEDLSSQADRVIHMEDKIAFPGAIDSHSHLNDPGLTNSEDFYTGTCSAAAGGITTVLEHPLTVPVTATEKAFLDKKQELEKKVVVDAGLWAAALPDSIPNIPRLKELGAIAFKSFLSYSCEIPSVNLGQLMNAMQAVRACGSLLAVHCENQDIIDACEAPYRAKEKPLWEDFAKGRAPIAERVAAQDVILLAKETGAKVHLVHTSLPDIVESGWQARQEGYAVCVETCPHYLTLTSEALNTHKQLAVCAPPMRSQSDVDEMWKKLAEGKISFIGSDHAAYTLEEKAFDNVFDVPCGVTGIQTMIPLLYSEIVAKRGMDPCLIPQLTAENTAKWFGLYPKKGCIAPGFDADMYFIDPKASWEITPESLHYMIPWTPYMGWKLQGRITCTMVRGNVVFENGTITAKPGSGKFVTPLL